MCIGMWIYLRHYINLRILYSILTEFRTVGPYELDWETQQYKCPLSNVIAFGLLAALQGLNLFWLYCLMRSAYRFVFYGIAKDDRSEAEESELEEMMHKKEDAAKVLPDKTEALPLLNNGNGVTKRESAA